MNDTLFIYCKLQSDDTKDLSFSMVLQYERFVASLSQDRTANRHLRNIYAAPKIYTAV